MKKETGGPAFPPMHDPDTHVFGITMRDYFAAKAMQGVIANMNEDVEFTIRGAEWAYKIADLMLKAREA